MTQDFTYPNSDLDRGKKLIALLGTFWSRIYSASDQLTSYATATALTVAQTHRNTLEVAAALSRYDVPLFHKELIFPIVLRRSQINSAATDTIKFNRTDAVFNSGNKFNVPAKSFLYSFPLPENLHHVGQIFNKITFPTVALLNNFDFYIDLDRNALVFADNPFENENILVAHVSSDIVPDEEIVLWGFCGDYDYNYVLNQFAYAVGLKLKTSHGAKELMNAVFNGLLAGGATTKDLDIALSAICGIPLVIDREETVEVIKHDAYGLFIATNKNVYRFAEGAEPLVTEGQKVFAGQPLVDGIEIVELRPGNYFKELQENLPNYRPAAIRFLTTHGFDYLNTELEDDLILDIEETCPPQKPDLPALAMDNGFLSACFYGDLVFENKDLPLFVETQHPSGYTYAHFPLNGLPADAKRFFDDVHERGIALLNQQTECDPPPKKIGTLARILDRRKNAFTEPKPHHLPATINPMRFLLENVLRNNVFIVRITVSALGQNQLGLYNIRHLRQLLPPQTAMIVVFELKAQPDTVSAAQQITEYTSTFVGMEPAEDEVPNENVQDLGASLYLISGTCH